MTNTHYEVLINMIDGLGRCNENNYKIHFQEINAIDCYANELLDDNDINYDTYKKIIHSLICKLYHELGVLCDLIISFSLSDETDRPNLTYIATALRDKIDYLKYCISIKSI